MKVTPKTEEELNRVLLLPEGEYDFEVLTAIEKQSSRGNEMIELKLAVYSEGERAATIFDYLLDSMEFKLRHFCDTVAILDDYNSGNLRSDILPGLHGKVKLKIEKDVSGKYKEKNTVVDYVKRSKVDLPF
jgi:hypothetical protein